MYIHLKYCILINVFFNITGLVFYDTKVTVMNRVLNATVQRTADHAAPEISLDPLEIVGGKYSIYHTLFGPWQVFFI